MEKLTWPDRLGGPYRPQLSVVLGIIFSLSFAVAVVALMPRRDLRTILWGALLFYSGTFFPKVLKAFQPHYTKDELRWEFRFGLTEDAIEEMYAEQGQPIHSLKKQFYLALASVVFALLAVYWL